MQRKLKKLCSALILLGVVLAFCSPVFAAGIAEGSRAFWDEATQKYKVGNKADFLGQNWTLWKVNSDYAYVITTGSLGSTVFGHFTNNYRYEEIHGVVARKHERNLKNYTGAGKTGTEALTWEQINGGSANYIAHSPTQDNGAGEDCLYLLSTGEALLMPGNIRNIGAGWWLRSPGPTVGKHNPKGDPVDLALFVDSAGTITSGMTNMTQGVRPALIINLKSLLFQSSYFKTALTGGKADVSVGDGFVLADYDGSKGWKLTMQDKSIAKPEITSFGDDGENISVTYKNAATGNNTYLSALLYDEKGNLINYAKVADTSKSESGKAEIPCGNLSARNYKIKFFCERVAGGSQNDYASELTGEYSCKSDAIFKTLNTFPVINGKDSAAIRYNGKRWAKLSNTSLLMIDKPDTEMTISDAYDAADSYASGIYDIFERRIKRYSELPLEGQIEDLTQSRRSLGFDWWVYSSMTRYVSSDGQITDTQESAFYRPVKGMIPLLTLKDTDNIYFLSAVGGAKYKKAGTAAIEPDDSEEWKITYKDDTLPAPALGGALTLNAQGDSTWHSPNTERIAALSSYDGADAFGYLLMKKETESGNKEVFLNGLAGDAYVHTEIIGEGYDRMSVESTVLEGLQSKDGRLVAMKLGKKYSGAENPVTLKNGFELSLEDKYLYKQTITSAEDTNVLYGTGEQGSKLLGKVTVSSGAALDCTGNLYFTELQLDGALVIKSGTTVTLADKPSATSERPLQIEVGGRIVNRGNEPVEVYDLAKQYKVTVPPGCYYVSKQGDDYEVKKIDWKEPEWKDADNEADEDEEQKKSSSSGGCNAGFGALALLALAGLAPRKRNE